MLRPDKNRTRNKFRKGPNEQNGATVEIESCDSVSTALRHSLRFKGPNEQGGATVETESCDSVSTVLRHSLRFKGPNEQNGAIVEIESCDCEDMRGCTVSVKIYLKSKRKSHKLIQMAPSLLDGEAIIGRGSFICQSTRGLFGAHTKNDHIFTLHSFFEIYWGKIFFDAFCVRKKGSHKSSTIKKIKLAPKRVEGEGGESLKRELGLVCGNGWTANQSIKHRPQCALVFTVHNYSWLIDWLSALVRSRTLSVSRLHSWFLVWRWDLTCRIRVSIETAPSPSPPQHVLPPAVPCMWLRWSWFLWWSPESGRRPAADRSRW